MEFNILTIFGGMLGVYSILCMFKSHQTLSWESISGRIMQTDLITGQRGYESAEIYYEYEVRGQMYHNNVVRIGVGLSVTKGSFSDARDTLSCYRIGQKVRVYYNPQKPKESCLQRGWNFGNIIGLMLAIWLIVFGVCKI
ncbi:DUF3592 domain-containing protein [Desulfonema magnum]|nr:DUF3592 domain-containing protein [Desulfonema magnum]